MSPGRQCTPVDGNRGRPCTATTDPAARSTAPASALERSITVVIVRSLPIRIEKMPRGNIRQTGRWWKCAPTQTRASRYDPVAAWREVGRDERSSANYDDEEGVVVRCGRGCDRRAVRRFAGEARRP